MKTKLFLATVIAFGMNTFAQVPTTGLMAYYPFSGNANDVSGNSNNGTVTGATLTTDRFGNPNSAYSFNGTSDSITCNNAPVTNTPFSISAWVKINSLTSPGGNPILSLGELGTSGLNTLYFAPCYGNQGTPNIGTAGANGIVSTNSVVTANVWTHVVVTVNSYSTTNVIFYVNAVSYTVNTTGGSNYPFPLNNAGFTIGKTNNNGSGGLFDGVLDDICIYNRVLSQAEVNQLYNITSCTPDITTGLVGRYDFTGNANDLSSNANNGTVTGATLTTDRFGNANSAYSFNGTSDLITCNNAPLTNYPLSISAWINMNSLTSAGGNPILSLGELGSSNLNTLYFSAEYGNVGTPAIGTEGTNDIASTSTVTSAGSWKHVVVTLSSYSTSNVIFYVNGVSYTVNATGGTNNPFSLNNAGFTIGKAGFTSPVYFSGTLDDIRIYTRILNVCDVDSLYNMPNPETTGIKTQNEGNMFSMYPNPASNMLYIENGSEKVNVEIYNISGQQIKSFKNSAISIDISDLATGMYFLKVSDSNNQAFKTVKLIKE